METKTKTLTMEEAIEKGYTQFVQEEGEHTIKFSKITEENRQYYKEGKYFVVDMENPMYYSINENEIRDLMIDLVVRQDDVADDSDKLTDIVAGHDYSKLAEELNEKFSAHKYYEPLDIEVTF